MYTHSFAAIIKVLHNHFITACWMNVISYNVYRPSEYQKGLGNPLNMRRSREHSVGNPGLGKRLKQQCVKYLFDPM